MIVIYIKRHFNGHFPADLGLPELEANEDVYLTVFIIKAWLQCDANADETV